MINSAGGLGRLYKYELMLQDPTNSKQEVMDIAYALLNDLEACYARKD